MNGRRLMAVARKEFLHIVRDPRSMGMALALPFLMLLLFGYALTLDVDRIPTIVLDADHSAESRELVERFRGSRYFDVLGNAAAYVPIEQRIDTSGCLMSLVIGRNYSRDMLSGRGAPIQLLLDGSDSNTASIALGYANSLIQSYHSELRARILNRRNGGKMPTPIDARLRVWYNSELKSKNYVVPGLIAVILMIIAALLTSLTIAREWEMGTMEQLLSTPLRASELVLGKMLAFFSLGIIDMTLSIVTGVTIFQVPLRGNLLFLALSSGVFLIGALCWGILLSSLARSQLLAYQMGMLTSFLPAFMLSGFIFDIENMPRVIQWISYVFPARYFVSIIKGVFLRGVGAEMLATEVVFLLIYSSLVFLLATRRLRQKVA